MKFKTKNKIIAVLLAFNNLVLAGESFDCAWLRDIEQLNNPNIAKTTLSTFPRSLVNMNQIKEEINNASRHPRDLRYPFNCVESGHLTRLVNEYAKEMGVADPIDKVKINLDEKVLARAVSRIKNKTLHSVKIELGESFLQNGNIDDAELKSIIMHELAHIKNQDAINEEEWEEKQQYRIVGTYFASLPIFYKLTKKFQPTRFKILNTTIKYAAHYSTFNISALTAYVVAKSRLSKKCEYQADADSLRCHKDLASSIESLEKCENYDNQIHKKSEMSSSESTINKCFNYLIGTHPLLDDRISNLHKTMKEINIKVGKS